MKAPPNTSPKKQIPSSWQLSKWLVVAGLLVWLAGVTAPSYGADDETASSILRTGAMIVLSGAGLIIATWLVSLILDMLPQREIHVPESVLDRERRAAYPSDTQMLHEAYDYDPHAIDDYEDTYPSDASMDGGKETLTPKERAERPKPDYEYPSDSHLLSEAHRQGAEQDAEQEAERAADAAKDALQLPGWFGFGKGQSFKHGSDNSSGNESFHEIHWIAFRGGQLGVSIHGSDFKDGTTITFNGADATRSRAARAWARSLMRAHGIWFPRKGAFIRLCYQLGWSTPAVKAMKRMYWV